MGLIDFIVSLPFQFTFPHRLTDAFWLPKVNLRLHRRYQRHQVVHGVHRVNRVPPSNKGIYLPISTIWISWLVKWFENGRNQFNVAYQLRPVLTRSGWTSEVFVVNFKFSSVWKSDLPEVGCASILSLWEVRATNQEPWLQTTTKLGS